MRGFHFGRVTVEKTGDHSQRAPTPDEFIPLYERALASQGWHAVDPLVHNDACVTLSNGTVHVGKAAVRAFEGNFAAIADEEYRISNIRWVHRGSEIAVYFFDFNWSGRIGGRPSNGSGRCTSVLHRHNADGDCSLST